MLPSHKNRWIPAGVALVVVALLVFAFWIAAGRETRVPTANVMEMGEPQIIERALDIAADDYQGKPTDVHANKTTMDKLGVISCSSIGAWVSSFYDRLQGELDWCNPNTPVWVVDLRGDFHQDNEMTHSLSIMLDGTGKSIRLVSGVLFQEAELD